MLRAIGDSKTCPHGHPIFEGEREDGVPLADVEEGAKRHASCASRTRPRTFSTTSRTPASPRGSRARSPAPATTRSWSTRTARRTRDPLASRRPSRSWRIPRPRRARRCRTSSCSAASATAASAQRVRTGRRAPAHRRARRGVQAHGRRPPRRASGRAGRAGGGARRAAAGRGRRSRGGDRAARRGRRAGPRGDRRAALLRVRRRRVARRRHGGRHARDRLGPDGVQPGQLAGRGRGGGRGRLLDQGSARPPGRRVVRLHHRCAGREHRRRSRPRGITCSPEAGWDVEADGLTGAPRRPRAGRGGAPRDDRPVAAAARDGRGRARAGARRRERRDGRRTRWPPRSTQAAGPADDRLRCRPAT